MTLKRTREGWSVRLRYGAGERSWFRMPALPEPVATARVPRLESIAALLAPTGKHAEARVVLQDAAEQESEQAFAEAEAIALELAQAAASDPRERGPSTFRDVGELWLDGELHRRFPDDVAPKGERSVAATRSWLAVVYPELGEMPLGQITLAHAERAKMLIPAKLARNSRRHYAMAIRRVLSLAVYPLRLIEQSPIPPGFVPRMDRVRAFPFLYPDEDSRLLRCVKVLPSDRLMYGLLARTGLRVSEAAALRVSNIDFRRGVLRLDKNKTRRARSFALSPDVMRALCAHVQGLGLDDLLFPDFRYANCARNFREHLLAAELDRYELHHTTAERRRMRIHDLRGTFVTLALAAGATETWVMDRTGHTTSAMLNRYRRDARHASELGLGWFEGLDWPMGVGRKVGHESQFPWEIGPKRSPSQNPIGTDLHRSEPYLAPASTPTDAGPRLGPGGVGQNPVELILAESLRKAIDAERWELAQDIARELGERRRERSAPSIPSLESARARKGNK
jgi:integrase